MPNVEWPLLENDPDAVQKRRQKFENWLERVVEWHGFFNFTPCPSAQWATLKKPLSQARVALVTTAGIHMRSQTPFDAENPHGDSSFRSFPWDTPSEDFMVSDIHYDHSDADRDINCILGIERLREIQAEGFIGSIGAHHYGFMGFIPDSGELVEHTAPKVASLLVEDDVDVVLLTPG